MRKGERYEIVSQTINGESLIEGAATLIKKTGVKTPGTFEHWFVRFDGDGPSETFQRWVDPERRIARATVPV